MKASKLKKDEEETVEEVAAPHRPATALEEVKEGGKLAAHTALRVAHTLRKLYTLTSPSFSRKV